MTATIELNSARRKLTAELGEEMSIVYFGKMKAWFKKKISKEDFDTEARTMLHVDKSHLHNEFLLAILNKCQTLANFTGPSHASSKCVPSSTASELLSPRKYSDPATDRLRRGKVKRKAKSNKFDHRFVPVNVANVVPNLDDIELHEDEKALKYAHREPTLPDDALIHGRMLLVAWEEGLESVEDPAVTLIKAAVEQQLRKMVTALVTSRNGYKLRDGKFPHAIGVNVPDPWLLNTQNRFLRGSTGVSEVSETIEAPPKGENKDFDPLVPIGKPAIQDSEREAVMEVACSSKAPSVKRPLNCFDMFRVLKNDKSLIPSHTVYSLNLERCVSLLYHPGHDD